ncbi:MAG: peptide MFS transporter [Gammaproteobacteria bacterium]|nr:peptide MFS transporter [Gammaproteobacteria bacterium]
MTDAGAGKDPAIQPTAATPSRKEEVTLLGHPRGLFVLFFAEMWERFSYYGMRALLVLYLAQHFLFDDRFAAGLVATYGSMVYLMPIIGGFIADRYLGFRKAVVAGAILLCCGHGLMAFEGAPASLVDGVVVRDGVAVWVLYLALAFIIVGVGFLKPAISNIVGQLYAVDDARRDQGFTIFYMGINLGALSAMLLCGWLGQSYGWGYGFGLAGIGMLAGLATFIGGQRWFQGAGEPPAPSVLRERLAGITRENMIYIGAVAAIAATWWLLQHREIVGSLLGIVAAAAVVGVILYSVLRCSPVERDRMFAVLFLTMVSVVFWTLFEQAGTSMTFFTERNVHKGLLGFEMQASQMGFLNPAFIILLAPLFSIAWRELARRGWEPSTPMKFGLGVVQAGLGFLVLVYGAGHADSAGQVAVVWLVLAYLLHTTGELCLSPVGLSMVTRLSVAKMLGLMMGVWFLSSAAATYLAGEIAGWAAVERAPGAEVDALTSLPTYVSVFEPIGYAGVAIGVAVMLATPLVKRLMHE